MIFLAWKLYLKHISPINVPKGSVNNMLALVKIMPWRWTGDRYFSGPMVALVYWCMYGSVSLDGLNCYLNMAYVRTIIMTITDTLKRLCYISGDNRRYVQGSFVYEPIQWKTVLRWDYFVYASSPWKTTSLIGRAHTYNTVCSALFLQRVHSALYKYNAL